MNCAGHANPTPQSRREGQILNLLKVVAEPLPKMETENIAG